MSKNVKLSRDTERNVKPEKKLKRKLNGGHQILCKKDATT